MLGRENWQADVLAAMKPREEGGVVDGRLNVYGMAFIQS